MNIIKKLEIKVASLLMQPIKVIKNEYELMEIGNGYGSWNILRNYDYNYKYVISAGLGEDASFDLNLMKQYGSKLLIVDPTPRAIQHFEKIISKDKSASEKYGNDLLESINILNFKLVKKALWNRNEKVSFYEPINPNHVSHSIVDYQHRYKKSGKKISVDTITISKLMEKYDIQDKLAMIKLDIEGAEVEVLINMIDTNIFPDQICVEFDELQKLSYKGYNRVYKVHKYLLRNGYKCINKKAFNYLYVNSNSI